MGKDRLATSNLRYPPLLEDSRYPPLLEDTFWSGPEVSRSHSNQQGDISAKELQEAADYQMAMDAAQEELVNSFASLGHTPRD
jgi:hypothetical protein